MIIIRLVGGLGNQMFQYALGRQLSLLNNRELKLDLSEYAGNVANPKTGVRVFSLSPFFIRATAATPEELKPFQWATKYDIVRRTLRKVNHFYPYYLNSFVVEPAANFFLFDKNLLSAKLTDPVYLDGFWQTEKYFESIEDELRKDFSFRQPPEGENAQMLEKINKSIAVSIHIRHGDNATAAAAQHGVLPLDYYHKAIDMLAKKIQDPEFYIFSDDPEWARSNLKLNYPTTFVSHNGDSKNYEDLRLMAACHHHIIGNSTFSWWGAWLGRKRGQLVFAPKAYHVGRSQKMYDYYPDNYILI